MEEISALSAAETVAILNHTDVTMVAQLPYSLIKGFEDKAQEYERKIELADNISLNEQNISEETRALLLILYREYWCDKEEKESLDANLIESEKEFNKLEAERLDPFKDSKKESTVSENITTNTIEENTTQSGEATSTALIELPKKWYVRIFDKIVRFFRKK